MSNLDGEAQRGSTPGDNRMERSLTEELLELAGYEEPPNGNTGVNPLYADVAKVSDTAYFLSGDGVNRIMNQVQWRSPTPDDSIPMHPATELQCIKKLTEAFKNLQNTNEKPQNPSYRRISEKRYDDWHIEGRFRQVLTLIKSIHENGLVSLTIFDAKILHDMAQTKYWTFEHRIDVICELLTMSKTACVDLMKDERTLKIIGCPNSLLRACRVNAKSNEARGRWVQQGRAQERGLEENNHVVIDRCVTPVNPMVTGMVTPTVSSPSNPPQTFSPPSGSEIWSTPEKVGCFTPPSKVLKKRIAAEWDGSPTSKGKEDSRYKVANRGFDDMSLEDRITAEALANGADPNDLLKSLNAKANGSAVSSDPLYSGLGKRKQLGPEEGVHQIFGSTD